MPPTGADSDVRPLPDPLEAVIFDLDGTLFDTGALYPDAAWMALEAQADEAGIPLAEDDLPAATTVMATVGLPAHECFQTILAACEPLKHTDWRRFAEHCDAAEHRLMQSGPGGRPTPGAVEVLTLLRDRGIRRGVASNCGDGYLRRVLGGTPLGDLVESAWCLDSPGVDEKADMLAFLLSEFDTRAAVMVGDRPNDRVAAERNDLPFIGVATGWVGTDDLRPAVAVLDTLESLPALLRLES